MKRRLRPASPHQPGGVGEQEAVLAGGGVEGRGAGKRVARGQTDHSELVCPDRAAQEAEQERLCAKQQQRVEQRRRRACRGQGRDSREAAEMQPRCSRDAADILAS